MARPKGSKNQAKNNGIGHNGATERRIAEQGERIGRFEAELADCRAALAAAERRIAEQGECIDELYLAHKSRFLSARDR